MPRFTAKAYRTILWPLMCARHRHDFRLQDTLAAAAKEDKRPESTKTKGGYPE